MVSEVSVHGQFPTLSLGLFIGRHHGGECVAEDTTDLIVAVKQTKTSMPMSHSRAHSQRPNFFPQGSNS